LVETLLSPPISYALAAVVVVVVLAGGGLMAMRLMRRDDSSERLAQFVGGAESAEEGSGQTLDNLDSVVKSSKRGGKMARDLARADLKLRVVEFVGIKIGVGAVGAAIGVYLAQAYSPAAMVLSALVGGVLLSFIPDMYVARRAKGRVKRFNDMLGDTITMMSNALRGGYSFLQTLEMVSREAPQPVSDEFRRVVQEVGLGRTTEEALENLQRRVPSEDLDLLITAVNIQHEVGGNLAQILDTIGHTIRERVRIKGEIQTLTAQGRISGYVITGLPIALAGYITMVNPDYMMPLFEFGFPPEAWCCMPVVSLVMIAIGYWSIMKIVDIEV
jgi:tight adherence protein B